MDKKVAVFDLDGTIADLTHRLGWIDCESSQRRWDMFFATCDKDKPLLGTIAWMRYMVKTHFVVILSGRSDECREKTEAWLHAHNVPYDALFMRVKGDHRDDTVLKSEMMDRYIHPHGIVDFIVDDRPSVLEMWQKRGFEVYAVTGDEWVTWSGRR